MLSTRSTRVLIAAVAMVSVVTAVTDVDASSYSVGIALQGIVSTISIHVNKLEGFSGNSTEVFTYNGSGSVSLPANAGTIPFPVHTIVYYLAFTRDVVLSSSTITSGSESRWAAFAEPVYLISWANYSKVSASPYVTYAQLQAMDESCAYLSAGIPFTVELKEIWVDGHGQYLPLIYIPYYTHSWPTCP